MGEREEGQVSATASAREDRTPAAESDGELRSGLQMGPELMLDLARRTAELLVERIEGLPEVGAWDGDSQKELEDRLLEDPPEADVIGC